MMRENWGRSLLSSVILTVVVAVFVGVIYPTVEWAIGQGAFKSKADGSLITQNGKVIGSGLLAQSFTNSQGDPLPQYFQERPSDAGTGYDGIDSGGSNLGPEDPRLVGFIAGLNTVNLDDQTSSVNVFATKADPYCVPMSTSGEVIYIPAPGDKYAKQDGQYVCDPNTVPERAIAYRQFNGLSANATVPVDAVTASSSGLDPDISIMNADLQAPRVARARHLQLGTVMQLIKENTTGRDLVVLGEPGVNVFLLNLALNKVSD
jgi:potassium-transporting ATPase KdpC subunit